MSWLVSAKQYIPAVIGESFGGGFFAGYISHTADGNPTHALIVAPRADGATGPGYPLTTTLQWKTANTSTAGTTSAFDGVANTAAIVTAGIADHPSAEFCVNLTIGGFTDWYLPARLELDIAYFNLKSSTSTNNVTGTNGINDYSVPKRTANYTLTYPTQTYVTAFNTTAQRFEFASPNHLSSTEISATNMSLLNFNSGNIGTDAKTIATRSTRAFRRIAL
jgi:hypothetical protein